jgi:c-di-GMP-binding flagellar brake protein YcgR
LCVIDELIHDYTLANKSKTGAIVLKYAPPAIETNIRAAFRLSLSSKFTVTGKMIYQDKDFFTPNDFAIRDISLNGIGMVIPRKSPLFHTIEKIKLKDELTLGLILVDQEESKPIGTVPVTVQIARINQNYSDSHLFIGCRFTSITSETDSLLNQFIHTAQIDELRRISGI